MERDEGRGAVREKPGYLALSALDLVAAWVGHGNERRRQEDRANVQVLWIGTFGDDRAQTGGVALQSPLSSPASDIDNKQSPRTPAGPLPYPA